MIFAFCFYLFKMILKCKRQTCWNINPGKLLCLGLARFLFTKNHSVEQREQCHQDKTHFTWHNKHMWKLPKTPTSSDLNKQTSWRAEQCGSTVSRNKCDVCLIGSIFLHKLDKWRKNYTRDTRDNFSADKSLMMSHLHFSIWAVPNIDHWTASVQMSAVKVMDAGEAISHPGSRVCSPDIKSQ